MACSGLLNPDLVRQIASKYNYEELDVSFKEKGSKLSFKHSWKEGCGGPDNEVIFICYHMNWQKEID